MSAEDQAPDRGQLLAEAIRVLTAAARLTRVVLDREEGQREPPADWAEFVAEALTGAAANVGSIEAVLAGRPGSWEADAVRQLLAGTVGHDGEHLLEHRTEPVHVVVRPLEVLMDAGVDALYDVARDEIVRRQDAAWPADVDHEDLTDDQRRELAAAEELEARLDQLYERDLDGYGRALATAVEAAARGRGVRVPVHVEIEGGWRTYEQRADDQEMDALALQLLDQALSATPVPGAASLEQAPRPPLARLQDASGGGGAA